MHIIKNYTPIVILFFIIVSCNDPNVNKQLEVINDVFLTVTDTVAYHELSLRPPFPVSEREAVREKSPQDRFAIVVPDTLYPLNYWATSLKFYCHETIKNENISFQELKKQICEKIKEKNKPELFQAKNLKDVGKYILIDDKNRLSSNLPVVGKIQFSEVIFDKEGALAGFMVFISDTKKAGIEKFYFLAKQDGKWKVNKTEIFTIY